VELLQDSPNGTGDLAWVGIRTRPDRGGSKDGERYEEGAKGAKGFHVWSVTAVPKSMP